MAFWCTSKEEEMQQFFLGFVVVFSGCTFDSQGLNAQTGECASMDCGHGVCIAQTGAPATCQCDPHWAGLNCDRCAVEYVGADCNDCADGYEPDGDECVVINPDPCKDLDCGEHGTCVPDEMQVTASCECETAYTGELCTDCAEGYELSDDECVPIIIDPCESLDCGNHGVCVVNEQTQSALCDCELGYIGDLCEQCDAGNGYIVDGNSCRLNPCFEWDCGTGSCVIDTLNWTASCACPDTAVGDHCEYLVEDSLIHQESPNRVHIQVKDPRWLDSTNTLRIVRSGTVTYSSNILYDQSMVIYGGWFPYNPCLAVDELVSFILVELKTGGDIRIKVEYLPPVNPADPHGFILNTSGEVDQDVFRAECYDCANGGCKIRPAGGATP